MELEPEELKKRWAWMCGKALGGSTGFGCVLPDGHESDTHRDFFIDSAGVHYQVEWIATHRIGEVIV